MNRYFKAKVLHTLPLNNKDNLLSIEPLSRVIEPVPGQFYMMETGNSFDPLLKRPFSYFRRTSDTIQFLYTVKGKGTSLMRNFRQGRIINIIGPLGNGYPNPGKKHKPLLIAGGVGIASIFSLAEKLTGKSCIIYGAKTKEDLLVLNEMEKLGCEIITCTDDCSFGREGMVTDIFKDFIGSHPTVLAPSVLYACGPRPMLKALSKIAMDRGIKGYISLEENMACGFGACLGCAVKTIHGYKRVCKEGPVFPIEEIVWEN